MASAVYFCLALFIFTRLVNVDAYLNRYISLISNVRKHYQTSSVFIVYSRNERYLEEYTLAHSLCRDFSRKHIFTLVINFEKLDERINWYRKLIGRPLVVILLRSLSDIVEFYEHTPKMKISYPIWLVIFTDEYDTTFCAYCKYPKGNGFGLKFDTEMLVMCCDNPILKEWWAVNENRTEISDFAMWTTDNKLTFLNFDGLYVRRHDLKGAQIRIGIVTNSALVREDGNRVTGLFGDVLRELKLAMNFTITETIRDPGFGTWSKKDKQWTGIVGELTRGRVDLGVADFTITKPRLGVIDYSLPITVSRSRLYIRDSDKSGVQWSSYYQAFTIKVWMAIICLIIIAPILLTVIKIRGGTKLLLSLVVENYVYVWGIFCQQGLCELPLSISLRIAYLSIFGSALVVSAAYSATLVSFFTVSSSELAFSSLGGFVNDGSYKVIVYQNQSEYDTLATAKDPVMKKMMALLKPLKDLPVALSAGWDQVCKQKVGLYTNDVSKKMANVNIKCKVVGIDAGFTDSLAMIMPFGSQYTRVINYHIQRFEDMGILQHLRNNYYTKNTSERPNFIEANLGGVAPVLAALTGGIILALFTLFCEIMYYSLKHRMCMHCPTSRNVGNYRSSIVCEKARFSLQTLRTSMRYTNGNFGNYLTKNPKANHVNFPAYLGQRNINLSETKIYNH